MSFLSPNIGDLKCVYDIVRLSFCRVSGYSLMFFASTFPLHVRHLGSTTQTRSTVHTGQRKARIRQQLLMVVVVVVVVSTLLQKLLQKEGRSQVIEKNGLQTNDRKEMCHLPCMQKVRCIWDIRALSFHW